MNLFNILHVKNTQSRCKATLRETIIFNLESASGEIAHQSVVLTVLLLSTQKWNVHDSKLAWKLPQARFQPIFAAKTSPVTVAKQFPNVFVVC